MAIRLGQFLVLKLFTNFDEDKWIYRHLIKYGEFCQRVLNQKMEIRGKDILDGIDWERPVFVIVNHQSYSDIPAIFVAVQKVLGFVAKVELKRIPFLTYWMNKINCVFIDRSKPRQANKVIAELAEKKVMHLAIFPEGTRSTNGKIGEFKSGAFRMALQANGLILPIVISGTRDGWEKRKNFFKSFLIQCQFLKPFDSALYQESNYKDLLNEVRNEMIRVYGANAD